MSIAKSNVNLALELTLTTTCNKKSLDLDFTLQPSVTDQESVRSTADNLTICKASKKRVLFNYL